jgi:ferredoxin
MPYVVTESCISCKYTDCVEVCPVDCFYEGPNFLAVQPDECIDCNACVPVCPVEAIYPGDQVPERWAHHERWNEYLANQWRDLGYNITEKTGPLENASKWEDKDESEEDILTWDVRSRPDRSYRRPCHQLLQPKPLQPTLIECEAKAAWTDNLEDGQHRV